jgi:UrcA family protein
VFATNEGDFTVKRAILVSFITSCALAPNVAAAQQAVASYSDLNLAQPADQARLERRVARAARNACGATPASGSMLPSTASIKCARQAAAEARAQVAAAIEAQSAAKLAARIR